MNLAWFSSSGQNGTKAHTTNATDRAPSGRRKEQPGLGSRFPVIVISMASSSQRKLRNGGQRPGASNKFLLFLQQEEKPCRANGLAVPTGAAQLALSWAEPLEPKTSARVGPPPSLAVVWGLVRVHRLNDLWTLQFARPPSSA